MLNHNGGGFTFIYELHKFLETTYEVQCAVIITNPATSLTFNNKLCGFSWLTTCQVSPGPFKEHVDVTP